MKIKKRIAIYLLSLLALVVGYWLFLLVLWLAPAFSGLPYALTKALAGVITLKLVDDLLLTEIPTIERLKESGTGYGIYVLGYAIIIAMAMYTA
jgi:hypothetical protein